MCADRVSSTGLTLFERQRLQEWLQAALRERKQVLEAAAEQAEAELPPGETAPHAACTQARHVLTDSHCLLASACSLTKAVHLCVVHRSSMLFEPGGPLKHATLHCRSRRAAAGPGCSPGRGCTGAAAPSCHRRDRARFQDLLWQLPLQGPLRGPWLRHSCLTPLSPSFPCPFRCRAALLYKRKPCMAANCWHLPTASMGWLSTPAQRTQPSCMRAAGCAVQWQNLSNATRCTMSPWHLSV